MYVYWDQKDCKWSYFMKYVARFGKQTLFSIAPCVLCVQGYN